MLRVLPTDIRYYNEHGKYAGIVLVHEPSLQTLFVQSEAGQKSVQYEFPYLVLTYNSDQELRLYYAYESIKEKTLLYSPALPNFGGGSVACWGNVKKPEIGKVEIKKLKATLWSVVFKAIYTNHSNSKVYNEMCEQKSITKYANNKNVGEPKESFKTAVNKSIGFEKFNLFNY